MYRVILSLIVCLLTACTYNITPESRKMSMDDESLAGWSKFGILRSGFSTDEVSMQAVFDEPGNYTVQFGLERTNPNPTTLFLVKAQALVTWSVAGNFVTRRISVGNGISITGQAEGVKVVIKDASDPAAVGTSENYRVSMQVTRGTRGTIQQPPVLDISTTGVTGILAGTTAIFTIPQDAGVVNVNVAVATVAGAPLADNIVTVNHTGNAPGVTLIKSYDPRDIDWAPVLPGTDTIRITNFGLVTVNVKVTFGIDG